MNQLPAWYQTLSQNPLTESHGFSFRTPEEIQQEKPSDFFPGKIWIGHSEYVGGYKAIQLWFDPEQESTLWFSFYQGDTFAEESSSCDFIFPVEATIESLKSISEAYYIPSKRISSNENILAAGRRVREAQPIELSSDTTTEIGYYIGYGDWDNMVALEDKLLFNPVLSNYLICQATSQHTNGNFTQYYTAFSASLYSLIRYEQYGATMFYVYVEYEPAQETRFMQHLKQTVLKDTPFEHVPDDMPLDVLGALYNRNSVTFLNKETLAQSAHEGDLNSLLCLVGMAWVSQNYEELLTPFVSHPDIEFRNQVAIEAFVQNVPDLLEKAIANGIKEETLASIRQAQGKG